MREEVRGEAAPAPPETCSASSRDPRRAQAVARDEEKEAPASHPRGRERDLDPGHRWHRPLQAPGITQVDFEERRRLSAPAPLPPRAHAASARGVRASGDPLLRPAQHPLHLEHGHRRVGARQADPLLPAQRQRRSVGVGLRLGGPAPQALLSLAARGSHPRRQSRHARARSAPRWALFEAAAKEIKDILVQEGVAKMPLGPRRVRAGNALSRCRRRASRCATGSR
jgi:hypothetical protein